MEKDIVCRLCLCPNQISAYLFENEAKPESYCARVKENLQISLIEYQDWPSNVCVPCVDFLNAIQTFKEKVQSQQEQIPFIFGRLRPKNEFIDDNTLSQPSQIDATSLTELIHMPVEVKVEERISSDQKDATICDKYSRRSSSRKSSPKPKVRRSNRKQSDVHDAPNAEQDKDMESNKISEDNAVESDEAEEKLVIQMRNMNLMLCHVCQRDRHVQIDYECIEDLKRHMKDVHNRRLEFLCCGRIRRGLTHMQWHIENNYFKCPYCKAIKDNSLALRDHLAACLESNAEQQFDCCFCQQQFSSQATLDKHMSSHISDRGPFKCRYCQKELKSYWGHHNHVKIIHGGVRFICTFCGASFKRQSELQSHLTRKHDPNHQRVPCDVCGVLSYDVKKHKRDVHTESACQCPLCGKEYSNKHRLAKHTNKVHSDKEFPCPICKKVFNSKTRLKEHVSTHTGIRPYKCNFCEDRFSSYGNKHVHHKRSHMDEYMEYKKKRLTTQYMQTKDEQN